MGEDKKADKELNLEKLAIGKILKNSRESLSMSVKEVAVALNIKEKDIRFLEQNTLSLITSHLYISGFVKSYAKLLKIDDKIIKKKLKELSIRSNVDNKKYKLINLEKNNPYGPNRETFFNSVLIFIMLFLLMFSFYQFSSADFVNGELIIDKLKEK